MVQRACSKCFGGKWVRRFTIHAAYFDMLPPSSVPDSAAGVGAVLSGDLFISPSIFYQFSLKDPGGVMTYTNQTSRSGGHYLQTALDTGRYLAGTAWRNSSLWYTKPSELENFYTLHLKEFGDSLVVTYTNETSMSGHYLQLAPCVKAYESGGQWRDSCLWQFDTTDLAGDEFRLKLKEFGDSRIVTYTNKKSRSGGHYLQLAFYGPDYQIGGKWQNACIFSKVVR